MPNPFRHFNCSPGNNRLAVMMHIRFPLSLRLWWNSFGPLFAAEIRKRRARRDRYSNWRRHLDQGVRVDQREDLPSAPLATKAKCSSFLPRNGGIAGCTQVSETRGEALCPAGYGRHGRPCLIPVCDECDRQYGHPDLRSLAQQLARIIHINRFGGRNAAEIHLIPRSQFTITSIHRRHPIRRDFFKQARVAA